jgi:hypothetical protein
MTTDTLHPLAAEYLESLRRAGRGLPPGRLRELLAEIEGHLSEAIDPSASDAQVLTVLDKLGEPEAIIEAETPHPDELPDRRGVREWAAIILLLFGGRFRLDRRSDSAVELARLDYPRQVDRNARRTRRPRNQRSHRPGRDRRAHKASLPWPCRRCTALHQRRRTEQYVEHSRSCRLRGSRAGSDRDLGLSRPPRIPTLRDSAKNSRGERTTRP